MKYSDLRRQLPSNEEEDFMKEYASIVGPVAKEIILYRPVSSNDQDLYEFLDPFCMGKTYIKLIFVLCLIEFAPSLITLLFAVLFISKFDRKPTVLRSNLEIAEFKKCVFKKKLCTGITL